MSDRLDLMKKGLLVEKREQVESARTRIRRLIDDLRVYTFYEDFNRPEQINVAALHQAACELQAEALRAQALLEEIRGLEK